MHERVPCHDEAANHQLPISAPFWIIQIVSVEESSSLTHNLMQICPSICSVIWNVMATQDTCSLNGIYHWPVQWSCRCSHMCIPVHNPWLPGYTDVIQTILIILTVAVLCPDRPCISRIWAFLTFSTGSFLVEAIIILHIFISVFISSPLLPLAPCSLCPTANEESHGVRNWGLLPTPMWVSHLGNWSSSPRKAL